MISVFEVGAQLLSQILRLSQISTRIKCVGFAGNKDYMIIYR